jgi:hypothetical protein
MLFLEQLVRTDNSYVEVDRIHLQAAKLRLDAIIEERERLAMDAPYEKKGALLDKLDADIDDMTKQIDNMNKVLELKADMSKIQRN